MSIFKSCDIRGLYGKELTEELALEIGHALGHKIAGRDAVVGGDLRESTPSLKKAVIEGLRSSGAKVIDLGIVPTPLFYFAKEKLGAYGGAMITASHNPKDFNGIKFILGELPPLEEDVKEIGFNRDRHHFFHFPSASLPVTSLSLEKEYLSFLHAELSRFGSFKEKFRIVIDAGNGSFSHLAPRFFRELNFEAIPLFCEPDGRFPSRNPNPVIPGSLDKLCRKVKEENADMGVAFDGDGDRVIFVDEKGSVCPNDKAIVILGSFVVEKEGPGRIVYDIKCSEVVAEEFRKLNCIPIMEKSGHSYIKMRMIKEKAVFAGELSGHLFFGRLKRDESLLASALMALKLSNARKTLSSLEETVPQYHTTPDIRLPYSGDKEDVLRKIKDGGKDFEVATLDGVRIKYPEGWGLVRISITEPMLTFRFEAKAEGGLKKVMHRFLRPVPELLEKIEEI